MSLEHSNSPWGADLCPAYRANVVTPTHALAIEVEAHGTNHNILSRYRGITTKQTPVPAVTTGF